MKIKGTLFFVFLQLVSIFHPSVQFKQDAILVSQYPGFGATGLPPGNYRLVPGDLVQIHSPNYGIGNSFYSNSETLDWRFTGDGCGVIVQCPCADLPASFQCLGDFLKFIDTVFYNQRFCGDVEPQGVYRSVSGQYKIRFRSDATSGRGKGFLCYVGCPEFGRGDNFPPPPPCFVPPVPIPTPTTTAFPGGVTTPTASSPSSTTVGTTTPPGFSPTTTIPDGMFSNLPDSSDASTAPGGQRIYPTASSPVFGSGGFLSIRPECLPWIRQRQIPVGESIRETRPAPAPAPAPVNSVIPPQPVAIPPWCIILS